MAEAEQAETVVQLPQKEQEASQQAEAASTADGEAGPGSIHSAVTARPSEDESQEGEGHDAEVDDSSTEYAGDLNVSDDEATLEEEEVNSYSLSIVHSSIL